ncbi:hypothetical protein QBC35DRAFT_265915 [Podospora australis]|uniref:Uncharacterized protein n=1 Tax=Podospora australis TaxID=1536484 RepID=A0AAN6WUM4_9PEZI|nr:hypothetical protein QBC35DRAFT_265915 [Podospora australis]
MRKGRPKKQVDPAQLAIFPLYQLSTRPVPVAAPIKGFFFFWGLGIAHTPYCGVWHGRFGATNTAFYGIKRSQPSKPNQRKKMIGWYARLRGLIVSPLVRTSHVRFSVPHMRTSISRPCECCQRSWEQSAFMEPLTVPKSQLGVYDWGTSEPHPLFCQESRTLDLEVHANTYSTVDLDLPASLSNRYFDQKQLDSICPSSTGGKCPTPTNLMRCWNVENNPQNPTEVDRCCPSRRHGAYLQELAVPACLTGHLYRTCP